MERDLGVIMSQTDAFGTITFVNDAFCEISKYAREEVVGKPHNIVRHPDMPPLLFKKLWSTIQAGGTFRAVIKNRAKDGSYYWVSATIMPYTSPSIDGTRYISARHLIEDEEQAERLFEQQMARLSLP